MAKDEKAAKPRPIGEILPQAEREGEKIKWNTILGNEIVIRGYEIRKSQFHDGDYALIDITLKGEECWTACSSHVVIEQLEQCADAFPVVCTPKQVKKYHTLR